MKLTDEEVLRRATKATKRLEGRRAQTRAPGDRCWHATTLIEVRVLKRLIELVAASKL
jgi:hypothetical protein